MAQPEQWTSHSVPKIYSPRTALPLRFLSEVETVLVHLVYTTNGFTKNMLSESGLGCVAEVGTVYPHCVSNPCVSNPCVWVQLRLVKPG